jgi:hypothetical protein
MNRIRANGLDFAYLEEGDGPLVILLHGLILLRRIQLRGLLPAPVISSTARNQRR